MVADALSVMGHPELSPLFGPGSRAEAAIVGTVRTASGPAAVSGRIDRLAVLEGEVLLADFKTSERPPAPDEPLPPAYAAQLALYRTLLREIYPAHRVRAFLIWTTGPSIRELDGDAALAL
jgi:ATP-dependent helicase/nuclease subunit A